jgi:hypothetical protein
MLALLLLIHGGGKFDPLAAFANSGTQKHGAQVLFNGAGTDFQLAGDLFVAATLYQQFQNFRIAGGDFYFAKISHTGLAGRAGAACLLEQVFRQMFTPG